MEVPLWTSMDMGVPEGGMVPVADIVKTALSKVR